VTAAIAALVDYAFGVWKLNGIEIRVGIENVRSRRVPERLGFLEQGVLREPSGSENRYIAMSRPASSYATGTPRLETAAAAHPARNAESRWAPSKADLHVRRIALSAACHPVDDRDRDRDWTVVRHIEAGAQPRCCSWRRTGLMHQDQRELDG
jgi:hypothetical protein